MTTFPLVWGVFKRGCPPLTQCPNLACLQQAEEPEVVATHLVPRIRAVQVTCTVFSACGSMDVRQPCGWSTSLACPFKLELRLHVMQSSAMLAMHPTISTPTTPLALCTCRAQGAALTSCHQPLRWPEWWGACLRSWVGGDSLTRKGGVCPNLVRATLRMVSGCCMTILQNDIEFCATAPNCSPHSS